MFVKPVLKMQQKGETRPNEGTRYERREGKHVHELRYGVETTWVNTVRSSATSWEAVNEFPSVCLVKVKNCTRIEKTQVGPIDCF